MRIEKIRIANAGGILGFDSRALRLTWRLADGTEARPVRTKIEVSGDPSFLHPVYQKEGALSPLGEDLAFTPRPRTVYYVRLTVETEEGDIVVSEPVSFETGKRGEPYTASWITPPDPALSHPVFFRRFRVTKPVARARVYMTAGGVYEVFLDGEKCGDEYLAPYFTDYRHALQVNTYALSLTVGEHTLSAVVGGGWYRGRFGLEGQSNLYGDRAALLGEMHLDYADGTHEVIVTDETWEVRPSDIVFSGIYDGEDIDRTRPKNPTAEKAQVIPDGGNLQKSHLVDRYSPALRIMDTLAVREVIHTPAGETVLDFGQNFAGFVTFRNRLPKGKTVTLDFGETLVHGNFYRENYRSARARFTYTSGGEDETVRPHFTYFGFRYVRVTGGEELLPDDFTGCVLYSDMEQTAQIETGNPKINRLLQNTLWGMRSNFLDMPTDCPQRDERLGWTGDAQVFAPTACYWMDTRAFYEKYLRELRYVQTESDGALPNYLPSVGLLAGTSSVWGDVGTFLPMTLWRQYGDREALRAHYPMMRDWVEYIFRQDEKNGSTRLWATGFHFGDWLALDGVTEQSMKGGTDDTYIASMYYCRSAGLVREAAEVLGYTEDAKRYETLEREVRAAILHTYFTPAGKLAVPTQTGYLLALRFGIYPDREMLLSGLKERLRLDRFRLKCGFVGAPTLCSTLAEAGLSRMAYRFLFREDYPSWLYCVNLGATTVWERWNSVLPDGTLSGTGMNSLNHYAYGSVAEFLFAHAAGLRPLTPGFTRARIAPLPDARLGYLDFRYLSAAGEYRVRWEIRKDGTLDLMVSVPAGCEAELTLPGTGGETLRLTPGTWHRSYRPQEDYLRLYDPETPLDEVALDPRAMAILAEKAPAFAGMAAGGDPENGSVTLGALPTMHYIPHDPNALVEALTAIYSLTFDKENLR